MMEALYKGIIKQREENITVKDHEKRIQIMLRILRET